MVFRNNWGMFMLDCYFDNLKQPNGEYRVGLRVCCDGNDSTGDIMNFAKDIVGKEYSDYVKTIRCINNNDDDGLYEEYELEAIVDCIFRDHDVAYHFIKVLGNMAARPNKSFVEVEAIMDGLINDDTLIGIDWGSK